MFTGIIDHCGTITDIKMTNHSCQLQIACEFTDLQEGESIAVNGCCLTVTHPQTKIFSCDLSPETMALTTAQYLQVGSSVNLERALRLMDRIGGHFVTGHIDQVAVVKKIQPQEEFVILSFDGFQADSRHYLIPKGSIAINGVSLTINQFTHNELQVMLIPHTLALTNLKSLKEGDKVNIEYDMLVKTLINQTKLNQLDQTKNP